MAEDDSYEQSNVAVPEPEPAPLPDYLTNPDATSKDVGVEWRFGKGPNYSNTRRVWAEGKKANHEATSTAQLVENLVKNWEVEASFKTRLSDWRTIDHDKYTFAMNGEPPQTAEHMLKVGTYNAIITPNEYYCPKHSDFASSHKTFKRMMPTFAWEVWEVYGTAPRVSFKWRHWGVMKNDYVGFNDKGEKVTVKAHGGPIEIFGVTTATVDDKLRLQDVDTYMDPLQMFRQIAPNGIVNKQPMNHKVDLADALDVDTQGNEALNLATASAHPSSGGANGATVSVTTCPVPHSQRTEVETPTKPSEAFTTTHAEPVGVELGSSTPVQLSSSTIHAGNAGSQSSETLNDEPISSAELHKSVDSAEGHDYSMHIDSGADSTSKADGLTVSDVNAGASQEASTTEAGDSNAAAVTHDGAAIKSVEKRSFDSTQGEGQSNEASTPHGKRVANETPGAEGPTQAPAVFEHGTILDGQAPTGTQHEVHPHPKDVEEKVKPAEGEAVAAPADSEETKKTHEEMGTFTSQEADMMNIE